MHVQLEVLVEVNLHVFDGFGESIFAIIELIGGTQFFLILTYFKEVESMHTKKLGTLNTPPFVPD